eukprot:CAMPEP_0184668020 /NCGR_PEP_ID=MMETSP0308-20130426/70333_1 /TAXON_ID=38269 /ORGANISM="Gloeochaete witrockiana, Strain SAG 46.84" /LENGTH=290 /DNA_ID=CAMNT_0027113529 /DNA_START=168 /DNA_END=1041 /DNA_ORIENTATION=-
MAIGRKVDIPQQSAHDHSWGPAKLQCISLSKAPTPFIPTPSSIDMYKQSIADLLNSSVSHSSQELRELLQNVALYPELLLDTSSAVPLLIATSTLMDASHSAISSYIGTSGSSTFLMKALKFLRSLVASVSEEDVLSSIQIYDCLRTCVKTVAASFSKCIDETLSWMPVPLFVHILEQDCLDMNKNTQIAIYMIVCRYYELKGVSSSHSDEILARKAPQAESAPQKRTLKRSAAWPVQPSSSEPDVEQEQQNGPESFQNLSIASAEGMPQFPVAVPIPAIFFPPTPQREE